MKQEIIQVLEKLVLTPGVPGFEDKVRHLIEEKLPKTITRRVDSLGNLIVEVGEGPFKILISAHMDEVGLLVTHIENDGKIRFRKLGGIDDRVLLGQEVIIHTENEDIIGVELGGAIKNVIAIAAGIIDGLGLGLNTRAALITRGLTEIRRLGLKLGANPRTFAGIAGVGDLILTCTGTLSRNHTVGKKIGEGKTLDQILGEMRMVAEGVKTAKSVFNLSKKLDVEMPICHQVYHILYDDLSPKEAAHRLMTRDLKQELDEI